MKITLRSLHIGYVFELVLSENKLDTQQRNEGHLN